jgi:hypothetical protein
MFLSKVTVTMLQCTIELAVADSGVASMALYGAGIAEGHGQHEKKEIDAQAGKG